MTMLTLPPRTLRTLPRWLAVAAALLLPLAPPASAAAESLRPFDTTYALSRGILTLGEARFRLQPADDAGCWRYEYQAKPTGIARLFIGNVSERSDFCVVDGELRSQFFEFKRADKPKDNFTLHFNWAEKVVRASSGELRQLESGMVDRLAQQIQVQLWVMAQQGQPGDAEIRSTKVEDDRIRAYRFRITGLDPVTVPAGQFQSVRVERVDDPRKSTRFWLAPEQGYVPVQVEQLKEDTEQLKMQLRAINPVESP